MLQIEIHSPDGRKSLLQAPDDAVIGKGAHSEVRLDSWRVAKEHARLFRTPGGVLLEDMGAFGGVQVNSQRIEGHYGPLKTSDVIEIGPFKLKLSDAVSDERAGPAAAPELPAAPHAFDRTMPRPEANPAKHREFEWRKKIHAKLIDTMDLRRHDISSMTDEKLRADTDLLIQQIVQEMEADIPADLDRDLLRKQVLDESVGLGPLEELLADDSVSEIMVNRFDEIFIERAGRLLRHPMTFTEDRAVTGVIERIVAPLGRRIDESSPMVDARLKDGSRVNAIIPPLALKGPCLTIRKFAKRKLDAEDLVRFGSISTEMAHFLEVCVVARKNIIVSGGTGSGKTTLLNILSNFIPASERIITVEDAAELKLHHEHLISLESRPPNLEGKGAVLIRDLVKNTLRMRPDRIVVGECRGAEALDMLQAMNTGHEGSLTTLHANSPRDALARLETMVLMAGMELPLAAIREQITSAVDIIVQQNRFACGSRLVTSITEVTGMESGKIQVQEIFRFHNQGYGKSGGRVQGFFTGCDMVPTFYEELRATGNDLDMAIFKPAVPDAEAAR
jgi:pilus assembly protein CpaF